MKWAVSMDRFTARHSTHTQHSNVDLVHLLLNARKNKQATLQQCVLIFLENQKSYICLKKTNHRISIIMNAERARER